MQQTMARIKLPVPFQDEVHKYLQEIDLAPQAQPDMVKYLTHLSPALQESSLQFVHGDLINAVSQLKEANSNEVSFLVSRMRTHVALVGDDVISQNKTGEEMFFVVQGKLAVLLSKKNLVRPETEPD